MLDNTGDYAILDPSCLIPPKDSDKFRVPLSSKMIIKLEDEDL